MTPRAIVTGGSTGGAEALEAVLSLLPRDFPFPVLAAQRLHPAENGAFARRLAQNCPLPVVEPLDRSWILRGRVYVAPAGLHMRVEGDGLLVLSEAPQANLARPSIDVLFESAAEAYGPDLVALLLSGTGPDGLRGIASIKTAGGLTLAQDPEEAICPVTPRSAIDAGIVDEVLDLPELGRRLAGFRGRPRVEGAARSPFR